MDTRRGGFVSVGGVQGPGVDDAIRTAVSRLRRIFDLSPASAAQVADRLRGIFEGHDFVGPDNALKEIAHSMLQNGIRCSWLAQSHIWDLSTSTSQPGEEGSKPCSTSQRTARRLRNDHHARITSRSTSVP